MGFHSSMSLENQATFEAFVVFTLTLSFISVHFFQLLTVLHSFVGVLVKVVNFYTSAALKLHKACFTFERYRLWQQMREMGHQMCFHVLRCPKHFATFQTLRFFSCIIHFTFEHIIQFICEGPAFLSVLVKMVNICCNLRLEYGRAAHPTVRHGFIC